MPIPSRTVVDFPRCRPKEIMDVMLRITPAHFLATYRPAGIICCTKPRTMGTAHGAIDDLAVRVRTVRTKIKQGDKR